MDARNYNADEILRDGGSIHLRAIRPDDKQRLLDLFGRLSQETIYFRFFRAKKRLNDEELRGFTELDFRDRVALVATLRKADDERIIAVGRYSVLDRPAGKPKTAEVAFVVEDAYQGRGIGTLLLDHLTPIARANEIQEFEADVLGENNRMLEVFSKSGFEIKRALEEGAFHFLFPTEETEGHRGARWERERVATASSVRNFFEPQSVAVIGASDSEGSVGGSLLGNLRKGGFTGKLHPVHPTLKEIDGIVCVPRVTDIDGKVDLALIAVPAANVEQVVHDCAHKGIHSVVVISAGFAETDESGTEAEARLRTLVRESGLRMVGPNCMGIQNTDKRVSMNATFAAAMPPSGSIGVLTQSGALGIAILDYVKERDLGVSSFVSVGNSADVSSNDLLTYWAEDSATDVIVLYLESFGDPRKFARIAPEVARKKPIVAVKSGRSQAGSRAASSHSAALASLDVAVDALFDQAGVIRTDTLKELFDVAALLSSQPAPPGPRVAVITNAGGPGILLADACEARGLNLPELSSLTRARLERILPPAASTANPVDMIASATPEQFEEAIEIVGRDSEIDCIVVIYVPVQVTKFGDIAHAIAKGAGTVPREKPVMSVLLTSQKTPKSLHRGPRGAIPAFRFPEDAAQALASAQHHAQWTRRERGEFLQLNPFVRSAIRAVVDRALVGADGPVWMSPKDMATILKAAGIGFADLQETTVAEAAANAETLGYPLVAKAIAPTVIHKSDVGGVILGLETPEAVEHAGKMLSERIGRIGAKLEGVLLQRQVEGGIEMMMGVTNDPTFGPLLVCGMGGVTVELLKDVAFSLPPVSDLDAQKMIGRLKSAKLLDGYRGGPKGDVPALAETLQRLSELVELIPEIIELDLNPVKVLQPGQGVIAVDGRIRLAPAGRSETQ